MISRIAQSCQQPWMGVYLRFLAVVYAYGGLVHYANLLGFGVLSWAEMPLTWQVLDVAYAALDTAAVVGLWHRTTWGVACFLPAAASQLVLYVGFPHLFAFTEQHRQALQSLVVFHLVTVGAFAGLLWVKS